MDVSETEFSFVVFGFKVLVVCCDDDVGCVLELLLDMLLLLLPFVVLVGDCIVWIKDTSSSTT